MGKKLDKERKAALLEGMVRRRQWRMNYKSLEHTVSRLPNREKDKALELIDELVDEGWAEYHKNGDCISLNSARRSEIKDFLEKYSDMENWMLESLF